MYEYKTELLCVGKKLTGRFDEKCISELGELINEKANDGWELVTYAYVNRIDNSDFKAAFPVTFKRKK